MELQTAWRCVYAIQDYLRRDDSPKAARDLLIAVNTIKEAASDLESTAKARADRRRGDGPAAGGDPEGVQLEGGDVSSPRGEQGGTSPTRTLPQEKGGGLLRTTTSRGWTSL
jgi:hypothetical protein